MTHKKNKTFDQKNLILGIYILLCRFNLDFSMNFDDPNQFQF